MKFQYYMVSGALFLLGFSGGLLISSSSEVQQSLKSAVVVYPAPTITLTAKPASVVAGTSTTVYWATTSTVSCVESKYGYVALQGTFVTEKLYAPLTLNLKCLGKNGASISKSLTIAVTPAPAPAPTLSFYANPSVVASGGTTTVYWSSTNTVSCSEQTYGNVPVQGSVVTANLYAPLKLYLTCKGIDGTYVAKDLVINISPSITPAPTLSFYANPPSVNTGGTTTVYWSSTNTVSCSERTYGSVPVVGSVVTSPLTSPLYLVLTCIGKDGTSITKSLTIDVASSNPPPAVPTLSFYATPTSVLYGGKTTVYWSSTNTVSCRERTYGSVPVQGSMVTANLYAPLDLLLTCTGKDGGTISQKLYIPIIK